MQDYVVEKTGKFLSGDNQLQIHTRQAEFPEEEGILQLKLFYPQIISNVYIDGSIRGRKGWCPSSRYNFFNFHAVFGKTLTK